MLYVCLIKLVFLLHLICDDLKCFVFTNRKSVDICFVLNEFVEEPLHQVKY